MTRVVRPVLDREPPPNPNLAITYIRRSERWHAVPAGEQLDVQPRELNRSRQSGGTP